MKPLQLLSRHLVVGTALLGLMATGAAGTAWAQQVEDGQMLNLGDVIATRRESLMTATHSGQVRRDVGGQHGLADPEHIDRGGRPPQPRGGHNAITH